MLRFKAMEKAMGRKAVSVAIPEEHPEFYYGQQVFNRHKRFGYLSKPTFKALIENTDNWQPFPRDYNGKAAQSQKQWVLESKSVNSLAGFQIIDNFFIYKIIIS